MTRRARGGLASSISALLAGTRATWVCAAMGAGEREIVAAGDTPSRHDGVELVMVLPDQQAHAMAYEVVSNSVLWFTYHDLFDKVRRPIFDSRWHQAWGAYREVNRLFADQAAARAAPGATVLVQDYQLHLVGAMLRETRPDLKIVHFVHTPFCEPSVLRVLPDATVDELLSSLAAYDACGFHSLRWCQAFTSCCDSRDIPAPPTFAAPLGVDEDSLLAATATDECRRERERISLATGGRRLIVRVDRMELSKNILRGFLAFDRMLESNPDLRGTVSFLALTYPSRESLAEYSTYRAEIETVVRRINARWSGVAGSTSGGQEPPGDGLDLAGAAREPGVWHPIILEVEDFYPRSVAAMSLYDVLLVNPVRDGLNLVAKEGPLINRNNGMLVLSREAGVWDELAVAATGINPFDLEATAEAMRDALAAEAGDRAAAAAALREAARVSTPIAWLDAQKAAAGLEGAPMGAPVARAARLRSSHEGGT